MLVLTRRIGETIVIDDDIRVTVLSVNGGKVRLGIAAPKSVEILREEIVDRPDLALIRAGMGNQFDSIHSVPAN